MARRTGQRLFATGGLGVALCLAALLAATGAWAAAGWSSRSSGTASDLGAVAFSNASHGLAVAQTARSSSRPTAGQAGSMCFVAAHDLGGVAFSDAAHSYAMSAAGTIVVSTNGGATWRASAAAGAVDDLHGVAFAERDRRLRP